MGSFDKHQMLIYFILLEVDICIYIKEDRTSNIGFNSFTITDDAFFNPNWVGACWGRWAGPGLMLGWSAGSECDSYLPKEQERRRAGRGFARSRSDA